MTCRVDSYGPAWAHGIIFDLDAGIPGHEAVSNATAGLRQLADDAEQRAILGGPARGGMDREQDDLRDGPRAQEPGAGAGDAA